MATAKIKNSGENESLVVNGIQLELTHPAKELWPGEGITKKDLVDYYRSVSKYILPYLKERPQSQHRYPNGIHGQSFYKKNMEEAPEWADTVPIENGAEGGLTHYLVCNNEATLVYMANLACIELHPWNSKVGSLDYPDWMVIDLDPAEQNTFEEVIQAALAVKMILDQAGVPSYPKTSGASGIHIYVPMGGAYSYSQVRDFAQLVAIHAQSQIPEISTVTRNLKKRGNKIYLDYLQNSKGQTLASAYSVRPRPGAPVSAPLHWDEVKPGLHPSQFTIKNILERIRKEGDLFKPVLGKGINLSKALDLLSV